MTPPERPYNFDVGQAETAWWRTDFRWARQHPWLWGVVFGLLMGLAWFGASVLFSLPDATVAKETLSAAVFGVLMGLGQFWAIRRRNRRRELQQQEAVHQHWTARSSFGA